MLVRDATPADVPSIAAILTREVEKGVAHFGTTPPKVENLREGLDFPYPKLVAEEDGKVVGIAGADRWKSREAYDWTVEINAYVRADQQGRGVGKALYGELFARLRATEVRTALAGIALPNEASVRLHESFGMAEVARLPKVGFKHGRWWDVGYWAVDLRPDLGDEGVPGAAPGR